ncbi:fimbrial protein [Pseudomonas protegens]|uniref:fimbrial protein n=1 Tax=Pseudomonas protegens TaxID=380021 RepID=UPI00276C5FE2|nr:fimbrial protein [Pseudomonas protegens]MDP9505717.1 fimbrial protein [Pseudomonas protegens]
MKRSWWVAGLASCLSLAVSNAYAHDVQLNFQGKVTESTCAVSSVSDVNLNSVSTNAFKGAGDVAGMKIFSVTVTGCDATKIRGKFNAPISDLDLSSGALLNTEPGGSTVKIQVLDQDYAPIHLARANMEDPMQPALADASGAYFNFYAQYLAGAEPVTAGDVKAKLMFDLVYE